MHDHILIATDGSDSSTQAMRLGIELAAEHGARVTLLTCSTPYEAFATCPIEGLPREDYETFAESTAQRALEPGAAHAKSTGVTANAEHLFSADPWRTIVDEAESLGCDLIVMATHGRGGIRPLLIGSQTLKVLTVSKIPVLVCH